MEEKGDISGLSIMSAAVSLYMSALLLVDCFSKLGAYITQNAINPLNDLTGGSSADYMQLLLEP